MSNLMFEIRRGSAGEVAMAGRLDATQCDAALKFLNEIADLRVIDLASLEYIASAGLRVILLTQKRCKAGGAGVRLINVTPPIHDIFRYAGFDQILDITKAAG
jgi:anti-sigma B factor antagonist